MERDNPKAVGKWPPDTDWVTLGGTKVPRCHAHNAKKNRCGCACMRGKNVCRKHGGKAGRKAGQPQPDKVRHGLFEKLLKEEDLENYKIALQLDEVEKLEHIGALITAKTISFLKDKDSDNLEESEERALSLRLAELRRVLKTIHQMKKAKPTEKEEDDITKLL